MVFRHDRDPVDREILDIIPERFDADPDSQYARRTAHTRLILTIALALLAVAALGVAARHIFFPPAPQAQTGTGVPLITADDKPIKTKPAPDERGGMDVPNRDKLIYEKMGNPSDAEPQTERLLPPPETPAAPPVQQQAAQQPAQPRTPSIKPAFQTPPPKEIDTANLPPEAPKATKLPPAPAEAPATVKETTAKTAAPVKEKAREPVREAVKEAAPAKAAHGGGWHVQLGSLQSEAAAKTEWGRIHGANKDLLSGLSGDVVRTDLGAKGIYWRIYAGPMDEAKARTICAQLAKRNQGCIVGKQ